MVYWLKREMGGGKGRWDKGNTFLGILRKGSISNERWVKWIKGSGINRAVEGKCQLTVSGKHCEKYNHQWGDYPKNNAWDSLNIFSWPRMDHVMVTWPCLYHQVVCPDDYIAIYHVWHIGHTTLARGFKPLPGWLGLNGPSPSIVSRYLRRLLGLITLSCTQSGRKTVTIGNVEMKRLKVRQWKLWTVYIVWKEQYRIYI